MIFFKQLKKALCLRLAFWRATLPPCAAINMQQAAKKHDTELVGDPSAV